MAVVCHDFRTLALPDPRLRRQGPGGGVDFECSSVARNRNGRGQPDCPIRPLRKSERAVELAGRAAVGLIPGALVA